MEQIKLTPQEMRAIRYLLFLAGRSRAGGCLVAYGVNRGELMHKLTCMIKLESERNNRKEVIADD